MSNILDKINAALEVDSTGLRKCAHCENSARIMPISTEEFQAGCKNCWCGSDISETESGAKESWNTRATDTLLRESAAEIERLRGALEEIEILDYSRAATNGCAHKAVQIARSALQTEKE